MEKEMHSPICVQFDADIFADDLMIEIRQLLVDEVEGCDFHDCLVLAKIFTDQGGETDDQIARLIEKRIGELKKRVETHREKTYKILREFESLKNQFSI